MDVTVGGSVPVFVAVGDGVAVAVAGSEAR